MAPRVSIGLPVRNGAEHIERAIESVLAQDYADFEMVICDNDSDDSTTEIVRRYAAADPRVKLHENGRNIGQIANMNLSCTLGAGEFFRWMGDDDWLEPSYMSRCVRYLDSEPEMIAVTTYIKYFDDDGNEFYAEYEGERLDSADAHRRFARMLWFLRSDYRYCDPHYSLFRRSALNRVQLMQDKFATDRLLAAELCLQGPYGHIPECLSHRRRVPSAYENKEVLYERNNPELSDELKPSWARLCTNFNALVDAAPLTVGEKAACRYAIARFYVAKELGTLKGRARRIVHQIPGYDRARAAAGR